MLEVVIVLHATLLMPPTETHCTLITVHTLKSSSLPYSDFCWERKDTRREKQRKKGLPEEMLLLRRSQHRSSCCTTTHSRRFISSSSSFTQLLFNSLVTAITPLSTALAAHLSIVDPLLITTPLLLGGLARLSTIYLSMYSDRATRRMSRAIPELQESFLRYTVVATHPRSVKVECFLASQKLKNERKLIFSRHGTSNRSCYVPLVVNGVVMSGAALGVKPALMAAAAASSSSSVAVAAAAGGGAALQQLPLAVCWVAGAALWGWNTETALARRRGFSDATDWYINWLRRTSACAMMVLLLGTTVTTATTTTAVVPLAAAAQFVGPFICGAAIIGRVYHAAFAVSPIRRLLDIPDLSPLHGKFGSELHTGSRARWCKLLKERTELERQKEAERNEQRKELEQEEEGRGGLSSSSGSGDDRISLATRQWEFSPFGSQQQYEIVKRQLEFECNIKFSSWRRRAGLKHKDPTDMS